MLNFFIIRAFCRCMSIPSAETTVFVFRQRTLIVGVPPWILNIELRAC